MAGTLATRRREIALDDFLRRGCTRDAVKVGRVSKNFVMEDSADHFEVLTLAGCGRSETCECQSTCVNWVWVPIAASTQWVHACKNAEWRTQCSPCGVAPAGTEYRDGLRVQVPVPASTVPSRPTTCGDRRVEPAAAAGYQILVNLAKSLRGAHDERQRNAATVDLGDRVARVTVRCAPLDVVELVASALRALSKDDPSAGVRASAARALEKRACAQACVSRAAGDRLACLRSECKVDP